MCISNLFNETHKRNNKDFIKTNKFYDELFKYAKQIIGGNKFKEIIHVCLNKDIGYIKNYFNIANPKNVSECTDNYLILSELYTLIMVEFINIVYANSNQLNFNCDEVLKTI